ncbi:class I SAM-dependent methyltransferase [Kitasatospora sp. NPDC004669]|uniref:SAM-dependent methyltransferase n=1 Tax=Kitasatospora sp. NPDC004669 TaxID=3154555 RepID=UPI0033BBA18E
MRSQRIYELTHTSHPVSNPVGEESVRRLLREAAPRGDERVLDLGCGEAAWLLPLLAANPGVTAEGVDISRPALTRARQVAEETGVSDRLVLHRQGAAGFVSPEPFDTVLCVGSAYAFGGVRPALDAIRRHLAPGGRVLIGDAFWERPPGPVAREIFGEYHDLATTVDHVVGRGWAPVYGHVSTRAELDEYEWCWTGDLTAWALDHPDAPDSDEALALATARRAEWLTEYRDCFGFLSLVVRSTAERA